MTVIIQTTNFLEPAMLLPNATNMAHIVPVIININFMQIIDLVIGLE